jgi:hypothetical protein
VNVCEEANEINDRTIAGGNSEPVQFNPSPVIRPVD